MLAIRRENRTRLWLVAVIMAMTGLAACDKKSEQIATGAAPAKPNIVFLLIDDMGWPDTEVYGNRFHETPNINQLAADGMVFTDAYAASPVCSSTRASIQSGQYPAHVGITDFIPGHWRPYEKLVVPTNKTQYLPHNVITVGEALKTQGYTTGYYGKWHLEGMDGVVWPEAQGYDEAVARPGGMSEHFKFGSKLHPPLAGLTDEDYLTDVLTDQALAFIDRHADKPFFLTLAHFAVHIPLQAKQDMIKKYQNKPKPATGVNNPIYAAMVEHVDESVGAVLDKLDEHDLTDNTVVVFYSDNGGLIERFDKADGVVVSTNAPLRSEKGSLYEGGIREPFIVKWPGVIKPGSKTDALMTSPDLFPTFVDIVGGVLPENQVIDGESLVPVLKGEQPNKARKIYFHYPHYHHSVPAGAVRQGDYKLIEFYDDNHIELYNLAEDIGETHDLSEAMPEKAEELRSALAQWRESVSAAMPTINENFDASRRGEWGRHPDKPDWNPDKDR